MKKLESADLFEGVLDVDEVAYYEAEAKKNNAKTWNVKGNKLIDYGQIARVDVKNREFKVRYQFLIVTPFAWVESFWTNDHKKVEKFLAIRRMYQDQKKNDINTWDHADMNGVIFPDKESRIKMAEQSMLL